jgi:protein-S-isoprenylcysteine O-methyltransferase Ste14
MALREELEQAGNWLFQRRSYLPLLLLPIPLAATLDCRFPACGHRLNLAWEGACLILSLLGLGVRVATVAFVPRDTSGRTTGGQEASSLNTTGLYSVVRHPLYVGNYLMWLGVAALPRVWWSPVLATLAFWLYYERIMFAEEEFLRRKFGAAYTGWAAKTPAFIPRLSLWQAAASAFSVRTVLRREYPGLFAVVACFTALDLAGDFAYTGRLALDPVWGIAFAATTVLCVVLRTLKHRTRLLHVEGR